MRFRASTTFLDPHAFAVGGSPETGKVSASRVIADLIESGLDAKEREKKRFLDLADRLSRSRDRDRAEQKRLKEELARITFGE